MSIHIKKSKVGSLHRALGVAEGKKIPASKLKIKKSDSPSIRKKKQFAINAKKFKHEEGGEILEYSLGGNILEGVGAGAGIAGSLSFLGPVGWGIGAAAGLGTMISGIVKDKKEEDLLNQKQQIVDIQARDKQALVNASWNNYANMAMGGLTPYGTPVEVEDKEIMRDPNDGSMVKFNGPTHAEGGIDIQAKPGSQVLGNLRIKDGKYKGLTYKEAADRIRQKIATLEKLKNS